MKTREISRIVPDATALKALAHPVRLRMLGMLRIDGPATATRLAERAASSWARSERCLARATSRSFCDTVPGVLLVSSRRS